MKLCEQFLEEAKTCTKKDIVRIVKKIERLIEELFETKFRIENMAKSKT